MVTLATSIVGALTCIELAKRGAHVIAIDTLDPEKSETPWRLVDRMTAFDSHAIYRMCTSHDQIQEVVYEAADHFHRIDALVGICCEFDETCDAIGVLKFGFEARPFLKESGHGKVVYVETVAETEDTGVLQFLHTIAREWAADNIAVNLVNTAPMNYASCKVNLRDEYKPEDLIGSILFLSSRESDNCTGNVISVGRL
jgi:NAD(P)-dependent dehydrogenase (short-subunit alcohol dehydrogenase family)